jgi:hypothetical protein
LGRCYINLPLTKSERGDPWTEVVPMNEEGLQLARRDGAVATISWLANNLGYEMEDLGRLDERLALSIEALDAARRSGDDELVAAAREGLAWAHLVRGERGQALREHERAGSHGRRPENEAWTASLEAVLAWVDHPTEAHDGLSAIFERMARDDQAFSSVARWLARMALRAENPDVLIRASAAYLEVTADRSGPTITIQRRWYGGLATDPDGREVEAAAVALEAAGYRASAVNAYADAALLAARAGRRSSAGDRAVAIAAEIGYHHALGPLPETPWIAASPAVRR